MGVTLVVATHSRYVVDLNRDPGGRALYPGADNTELCPTRTFADEAIYAAGANATVVLISFGGGRILYLGWDYFGAAPLGANDGGWLDD
jgi:hypothetical protein